MSPLPDLFSTYELEIWISIAVSIVLGTATFLWAASAPTKVLPLDDFEPFPLVSKRIVSHDTIQLEFGLPTKTALLGLPVGQHVSIKFTDKASGKTIIRSYTPVSRKDTPGSFTLVLKVYKPNPPKFPNGGLMSQYLDSVKIGETVLVRGPKGHVEYLGKGKFTTKPLGKPLETRCARNFVFMAGGTGITPCLQVIHEMLNDNHVNIKLLYANQSPDDILLRDELDRLNTAHNDNFSVWYTVDKNTQKENAWKYDIGYIDTNMVQAHANFDSPQVQFMLCGPPPMIKFACLPALKELGYTEKNWTVF